MPHPPLVPLQSYLDLYRDIPIDKPWIGDWAQAYEEQVYTVKAHMIRRSKRDELQIEGARRAFYALCTHIDHQIRLIVRILAERKACSTTPSSCSPLASLPVGRERLSTTKAQIDSPVVSSGQPTTAASATAIASLDDSFQRQRLPAARAVARLR